jgi:type IV pilus assembly protein PilO
MPLLPKDQKDQAKLMVGLLALALGSAYWAFPHDAKKKEIGLAEQRADALENANRKAKGELASKSLDELKSAAATTRSTLVAMRRLVPTGNEVPALLEEVSTAARRAGLDVGAVTPEPMIEGELYDTYRYTVTILGGYHSVGAFLANVGSLPRIVAPVKFGLGSGGSQSGPGGLRAVSTRSAASRSGLESTITLQTYVERVAPERPARPSKTGGQTS